MPWRHRLYRWYRDSPGCGFRWLVLNFIVFVGFGLLFYGVDQVFGSPEYRWGLVVFSGFITGFSAVAVFNVVMELVGLGYHRWKAGPGG